MKIEIGQVYEMRAGHKPKGSIGQRVVISSLTTRDGVDYVGARRWIESKRRFSGSGFSYGAEAFLTVYRLSEVA